MAGPSSIPDLDALQLESYCPSSETHRVTAHAAAINIKKMRSQSLSCSLPCRRLGGSLAAIPSFVAWNRIPNFASKEGLGQNVELMAERVVKRKRKFFKGFHLQNSACFALGIPLSARNACFALFALFAFHPSSLILPLFSSFFSLFLLLPSFLLTLPSSLFSLHP